jgi:cytochrome c oxidase subunit I+III
LRSRRRSALASGGGGHERAQRARRRVWARPLAWDGGAVEAVEAARWCANSSTASPCPTGERSGRRHPVTRKASAGVANTAGDMTVTARRYAPAGPNRDVLRCIRRHPGSAYFTNNSGRNYSFAAEYCQASDLLQAGQLQQNRKTNSAMSSTAVSARLTYLWETPRTLWGSLTTVDHKTLGKRYIVTALAFLLAGGIEALIMRLQLAQPGERMLAPETYDQIFTMHGSTMIYWYAAPILSGFSVYLVPLMIGARDMAFPRANAFSYWVYLFSGIFLYTSLLIGQAPHAGWFAYTPYTEKPYSPALGMDYYAIALIFLTISQTVGAINFLVTIFRHRAPGMTVNRMPIFMYSTSTNSVLSILSMPTLCVACLFLLLDRNWGMHFFDVTHGGSTLLWQQLFWFFAHPWVYIVFLPATGMISMILPVFSRRPIVGYAYVAISTVLTGAFGFGVWMHHMFATGEPYMSISYFSAASMMISLFSTIQIYAWIATLWRGKPVLTTSMCFALAFIAVFVIGGLNGTISALIPFDWQLNDSYWIVAHIHYVLVGANLFPVMAGLYYWLPKMTGRMMDERAGMISFWMTLIGMNATFFPMHFLGLLGMPRRIYTYSAGLGWGDWNLAMTWGAFLLGAGIVVSIVNFIVSSKYGRPAGPNPWNADTLEWSTPSPPPAYGSVHIPTVQSRHPLWDAHDEEYDPEDARVLDHERLTLSTTWLDARPVALAKMPEDSIWPLLLALAIGAIAGLVLVKSVWWTLAPIVFGIAVTALWLWPKQEKRAE